jgi:hypothetical protein
MTTLTEFVLARIEEDWEAALRRAASSKSLAGQLYPARARADYEAKRQIVGQVFDLDRHDGYTEATRDAVRSLAAVYADHPDYREEWRP